MVLLLVFGAVFFTIFTAFMGFVITGKRLADAKFNSEQALQIAEAGINYYKWFLAHHPDDMKNGTNLPGPYEITFFDPEGGATGEYSLQIDGNLACGVASSVDIVSTGHTYANPDIKRTVSARYARPNVAEYSHIVNANVWAGPDRQIYGPYHSNGFVRMDGTNNSSVTSGQGNSRCRDIDLCLDNPPTGSNNNSFMNGVFGAGSGNDLWTWAVPPISFSGVTVDLSTMLDKAKNGGGVWRAGSGASGYYVVFNNNGTFTLRKLKNSKTNTNAQGMARSFLNSYDTIGTYSIPSGCGVLYFEDNVWVEGTVKGKVTLAAANINSSTINPTIAIMGNLNYADDKSGLLLVAEKDILIGLDVPTNMTIKGIFIAQTGLFGRPHFTTGSCGATSPCVGSIPSNNPNLSADIFKTSLTTYGTVVSNGRVGTKWIQGTSWVSGFNNRYDYYDRDLAIDPPPLTPKTSDDYQFIEWRDMD